LPSDHAPLVIDIDTSTIRSTPVFGGFANRDTPPEAAMSHSELRRRNPSQSQSTDLPDRSTSSF
jgi:hypothetical protein